MDPADQAKPRRTFSRRSCLGCSLIIVAALVVVVGWPLYYFAYFLGETAYEGPTITRTLVRSAFDPFTIPHPPGVRYVYLQVWHGLREDASVLIVDVPENQVDMFITGLGFTSSELRDSTTWPGWQLNVPAELMPRSSYMRSAHRKSEPDAYPHLLFVTEDLESGPLKRFYLQMWWPFT